MRQIPARDKGPSNGTHSSARLGRNHKIVSRPRAKDSLIAQTGGKARMAVYMGSTLTTGRSSCECEEGW